MKQIEFTRYGNAIIRSGLRSFDRYCTGVMIGNIVAPGQFSTVIRAGNDLGNDLHTSSVYKTGKLQRIDLRTFRGLPTVIREYVVTVGAERATILYEFYDMGDVRTHPNGKHTTHGYILTNAADHAFIAAWGTGPSTLSHDVLRECANYICTHPDPVELPIIELGPPPHPTGYDRLG